MKCRPLKLCIAVLTLSAIAGLNSKTLAKAQAPTISEQASNEATLDSRIEDIVDRLIQCESGGKNITIIDSNGLESRGILQYQDKTWEWFSKLSGITGKPTNDEDAKKMTRWAVKNGYGENWTCWKKI